MSKNTLIQEITYFPGAKLQGSITYPEFMTLEDLMEFKAWLAFISNKANHICKEIKRDGD